MKNLRAVPSKKPDKHSKRLKRISPGAAYLYRAVIIPKMQEKTVKIPKRILNSLLASMAAGVVPRSGAKYIAIGRTGEIAALCRDLDAVADGGSATRFIIGKYGSCLLYTSPSPRD